MNIVIELNTPIEVYANIAVNLTIGIIYKLCKSNVHWKNLCNNDNFWRAMLYIRFNKPSNTPKITYLENIQTSQGYLVFVGLVDIWNHTGLTLSDRIKFMHDINSLLYDESINMRIMPVERSSQFNLVGIDEINIRIFEIIVESFADLLASQRIIRHRYADSGHIITDTRPRGMEHAIVLKYRQRVDELITII